MWQLLHENDLPKESLSAGLLGQVSALQNYLRGRCVQNQIPSFRHDAGMIYYTFAGYLVNKAIGLRTGKDFKAEEFTLWTSSPIDWVDLPENPEAYGEFFASLFEVPSDLSVFQSMLPSDLQLKEFLQIWLKDKTIEGALHRLRNSEAIEVDANFFS
jgi:ATP-dependent Lhr-like helicase